LRDKIGDGGEELREIHRAALAMLIFSPFLSCLASFSLPLPFPLFIFFFPLFFY